MRRFLIYFTVVLNAGVLAAQTSQSTPINIVDYKRTKEYTIADIEVTGVKFLNPTHLVSISGLRKGMKIKIPGSEISEAIRKYWKHGLFADAQIVITKIEGDQVWLEIQLIEQPRLSTLTITGVNKSEKNDIEEKIELRRGLQITDNILNNTITIIKRHFIEKGFFNTEVNISQKEDTSATNRVDLLIDIKKNDRVKIEEIVFEGNEVFTDKRLRRVFKKTKQRDLNIFKGSKFLEAEYKEDKQKLINFYNEGGYRDAKIVNEEITKLNDKRIALKITVYEGNKYYIRSLNWVGNTKYPSEYLNLILGIKVGDLYDKTALDNRLRMDEDAVSSVYMDNGYLFFNVSPVEKNIENDSVDLDLVVYEGKQATINEVIIRGNTKTNEHVVRRELYTRPGDLFSKTYLIRSVREIATLGHFNPETIAPNPIPNQADGTVDIEYQLEERANDQLELSGGWGGYGFVGSIGIQFSNFSARNILDLSAWRPVPSGDGQTLSLRAQANYSYRSFNITFVEPWFGGKKPNSFSVSLNYTIQEPRSSSYYYYSYDTSNVKQYFKTIGGSVGLGKRLKWPDDYFSLYTELSYHLYKLQNWYIGLDDGNYNLLSLKFVLSRSSQDQMIYPRKGSAFSLGLQVTPPYSVFSSTDYSTASNYEKYKNIEFHKWTFSGAWYTALIGDLVLALKSEFGYLGYYNSDIKQPRFEKFDVGGDGLSGYNFYGTDVIPLRGYENGALTPQEYDPSYGYRDNGNIYDRFYAELRYPVTTNPSATIYGLTFVEGGNAWQAWNEFNPFAIKRSAGVGVRAFLPMFGLLGFDWGYGFDPAYGRTDISGSQFHFIIGQQF